MKDLGWYWHRLRAMSPAEMWGHARKKWRQRTDRMGKSPLPEVDLAQPNFFPRLQLASEAPPELLAALESDVRDILAGHWRAFGHLPIQVDDPPHWHQDYWVGRDLATRESAFRLNHRALPEGADVKLIWELSRWYQLLRLAQASYVLRDEAAGGKCLDWLEDWLRHNPPLVGWNWTSALEVGMRLIQFTWIDALLDQGPPHLRDRLHRLRPQILLPHVAYAWRYRSFGSSANNHLLGELVGLLLAVARWPSLAPYATSLDELQRRWEAEVLAQFAPDGGNREQALNYQLFSFEFCWQAHLALQSLGRTISPEVEIRLADAAQFFWEVQVRREPWDYGDSDSAFVSPLFGRDATVVQEWGDYLDGGRAGECLRFWLGSPPPLFLPALGTGKRPKHTQELGGWWVYPDAGIGLQRSGFWRLRWDLSPLGYLSTAAHGHLDALHLSIWFKGVAFVVDPGTGAYYADSQLRAWLASRHAHNGPHPVGVPEYPRRLGPFLWQSHHLPPTYHEAVGGALGVFNIPGWQMRRRISSEAEGAGWRVEDSCVRKDGTPCGFTVRWQFAPGTLVRRLSSREFLLNRQDCVLRVVVSEAWRGVEWVELGDQLEGRGVAPPLAGTVSPAFRRTERAPYLALTAEPKGDKSCVFSTTFLVSAPP